MLACGATPRRNAADDVFGRDNAERLIGSIRRECLDHVIVLNDAHLIRILTKYFNYYHCSRPHQSLDGNSPEPRETQMPERRRIVSEPVLGGLHHCYRRAA